MKKVTTPRRSEPALVPLRDVERELARRQRAVQGAGDNAVVRACMSSLIIFCDLVELAEARAGPRRRHDGRLAGAAGRAEHLRALAGRGRPELAAAQVLAADRVAGAGPVHGPGRPGVDHGGAAGARPARRGTGLGAAELVG